MLVLAVPAGLNTAVTPFGNPLTARLTLPLKPYRPVTLMVLIPLLAWITLRLAGEAERLKLGATTDKLIAVVLLKLPEVPVMVSG